jgi:hypothetical protein
MTTWEEFFIHPQATEWLLWYSARIGLPEGPLKGFYDDYYAKRKSLDEEFTTNVKNYLLNQ